MDPQRKKSKTFLRRSVPKLFLILTASIPAAAIPTYVIAKNQKENTLKYVEGEYVGSKINEPLSPTGRFQVGQKANNNRFVQLIGENPGPYEEPVQVAAIQDDETESLQITVIQNNQADSVQVAVIRNDQTAYEEPALVAVKNDQAAYEEPALVAVKNDQTAYEEPALVAVKNDQAAYEEPALVAIIRDNEELIQVSDIDSLEKPIQFEVAKEIIALPNTLDSRQQFTSMTPTDIDLSKITLNDLDHHDNKSNESEQKNKSDIPHESARPLEAQFAEQPVQSAVVNETVEQADIQPINDLEPINAIPPNHNVTIPQVDGSSKEHVDNSDSAAKTSSLPDLNLQTPANLNVIPTAPAPVQIDSLQKQQPPKEQGVCLPKLTLNPNLPKPIDITEIADNTIATPQAAPTTILTPQDQQNTTAPQETQAPNPRTVLKLFPLRPENYNKDIKKELNSSTTEPSQTSKLANQGNTPATTPAKSTNTEVKQPKIEQDITPQIQSQNNNENKIQQNIDQPKEKPFDQTQILTPTPSQTPSPVSQTQTPAAQNLEANTPNASASAAPSASANTINSAASKASEVYTNSAAPSSPAAASPQATPEPVPTAGVQEPASSDIQLAPPQSQPVSGTQESGFLTNFNNLNIKEYIRFISRITNKNFVFNEDELNFNLSMISQKRESAEDLITTLMQQLRIHGLAVMEEGDTFIIHTNPEVNAPSTVFPRTPDEEVPDDVQTITQVFRLNVVDPSRAVTIIKPLLSSQAIIEPLDEAGILTLTDLKVNIDKIRDLLHQLDFPSSGLDVSHFRSEFINADTLASLGEKILTPIAEGKELRLIPLKDTNTVFIISTPIIVRRAVEFFEALDKEIKTNSGSISGFQNGELIGGRAGQGGAGQSGQVGPDGKLLTEEERRRLADSLKAPLEELNQSLLTTSAAQTSLTNTDFDIYKLEYRKGDQIQQALSQIADSLLKVNNPATDNGTASTTNNDLYNAISSVQWIEASNTLIYTGTLKANDKIKQLIQDLDVPNQQVLIEMLLLDTSIDKSYSFGVDWATRFGGPTLAGSQAFLSPLSPLATVLNQSPNGLLNAENLSTNTGFSLGVIGQTISCDGFTFSTLGGLVTALHDSDIARVVLNPKIVVEENTTAEVFAGLNIPFKTQSIANDFGTILTNNFEYRDIGARMRVTPIINKNGVITLEIEQELQTLVSSTTSVITNSFFDTASTQGAGPTTRKSNSKTTLFVPNGYFVILAGILQDESERERRQVPCLGGVPVLGGAFSQKQNRIQNRNLIIYIRPSLINTPNEMTSLTKREQDIYDQKCREKDLWKYEIDEALDFLNIKQDHCNR